MDAALDPSRLRALRAGFPAPMVIDVRRAAAFAADPRVIPGALRCLPEAIDEVLPRLESWRGVVAYCVHGHEVSQAACAHLAGRGVDAHYLQGGLEGWLAAGGEAIPYTPPTRWVTRARPKIDRIACPWLIRRFIDPAAEIHYVPAAEVVAFGQAHDATPFDIPGADYGHHGEACSFDAFIRRHALADPALLRLATIVRAADTDALAQVAEAPGLLAASRGLSRLFADDHAMLRHGMLVYDALYLDCQARRDATV